MAIIILALVGALFVTVLFGVLRAVFSRRSFRFNSGLLAWLGILFVVNFLLSVVILYFDMPALTGPYGGWQWLFWPIIISGILSVLLNGYTSTQRFASVLMQQRERMMSGGRGPVIDNNFSNSRSTLAEGAAISGVIAIIVVLFMGLVVNGIIVVATTWFDGNAKSLAALPIVEKEPSTSVLPPTDVRHIVLVTQAVAAFKGQQVLGQNGKNLGSKYHFEQTQYTLQSVKQHLYWIAPLVYNNIFANLGNYDTPAFVAVDAENPDAQPQIRDGYHLHYVPNALLNQDLLRHVYLSGYTYGILSDPTLEVNDDWQPFYTISVLQPTHGFTGNALREVLLVDPQSGAITKYTPKDVPTWVDRVVPADLVSDYLGWWGLYSSAPWFNPSGAGQQNTANSPELVYNSVDQPVWLVPMTSSARTDNSSTGIMLFDTKNNQAKFYPLAGIGIGDTVVSTFEKNPVNLQHYSVTSTQLYSIFGQPTWVGIFTQTNSQGDTFQAVALLDAHSLNGGDVQMAPTLNQALSLYQQWQATNTHGTSNGNPNPGSTQGSVSGKVIRVAPTSSTNGTVYYIWIEGQSSIFTAPLSLSPLLPLVQPGDIVTATYAGTFTSNSGVPVITLTSFNDTSIQLATPTVNPTVNPTPTPVPTP